VNPSHIPAFTLPAITLLITLGYLLNVWLRPFKTCRRCHGMGRTPARIGRPKPCRRCHGHGIRPRAFRRPGKAARHLLDDARSITPTHHDTHV